MNRKAPLGLVWLAMSPSTAWVDSPFEGPDLVLSDLQGEGAGGFRPRPLRGWDLGWIYATRVMAPAASLAVSGSSARTRSSSTPARMSRARRT